MRRHVIHSLRNLLQSALLVTGMAALAAACAWILWGGEGVVWALSGLALGLLISPSVPPRVALSLYRARPLAHSEFPDGYALLDALSRRAGLPGAPQLYYVPSDTLNAFTVGTRRNAAIAVTDGILRRLNRREFVAVLAHEVSHVANNDLWIMNLADTMSRATTFLAYLGLFLLAMNLPLLAAGAAPVPWLAALILAVAPHLMSLLQLALSRAREYAADIDAARLTGDPVGLAAALAKMERRQARLWEGLFIPGRRMPEPSFLRTHPPTEERVHRLMQLISDL